ncbi:MAG: NTP transferase domain-containing protein [Cyanobacteria bacterium J06598_3]
MMPLSVMILAGGQSRRMGQDKALLPGRDGQPLLCQTVRTALQLAPRVVIVTPWPERYRTLLDDVRSRYNPALSPSAVQLVQEPLPNASGPLGGFFQGWEVLTSSWCLLLACDLPYLEASVLQDWWQQLAGQSDPRTVASLVPGIGRRGKQFSAASGGERSPAALKGQEPPAVIKGWEPTTVMKGWEPTTVIKGWEPLCGFYHRRGLLGLKRYLAGGGRSFQGWLADVPVTPYYGVPNKMLFNCNTPQDWESVQF